MRLWRKWYQGLNKNIIYEEDHHNESGAANRKDDEKAKP